MQTALYIIFSLVPTIMAQQYTCTIKQGRSGVPCLQMPGSKVIVATYNGGDKINAYCWKNYWTWLQSDSGAYNQRQACYVGAGEIDSCSKYLKGLSMGNVAD